MPKVTLSVNGIIVNEGPGSSGPFTVDTATADGACTGTLNFSGGRQTRYLLRARGALDRRRDMPPTTSRSRCGLGLMRRSRAIASPPQGGCKLTSTVKVCFGTGGTL